MNTFSQKAGYWQQQTNYKISVSLNDIEKTLTGTCDIEYINNSPDTLTYIWFHLWPNAYKNDKTAFSEQLLLNGRTDFYFSDPEQRGYINRLNFTVNGKPASTEDHPLHQDIVKLLLPQSLAPGQLVKINTPFHVKLPEIFSRSGYKGNSFQVCQWYPQPAVYDSKGWHPIPYLDQGEFYSEFGNFEVSILVPSSYIIAATGNLISKEQNNFKTNWLFKEENIHDFAWFADKDFILKESKILIDKDSITLKNYVLPADEDLWKNSLEFTTRALQTKSEWLGTYPYKTMSVVDDVTNHNGGMEYPTITVLSAETEDGLEELINHETGHNWFYGILATNERKYPWMDEGLNSFYDAKYRHVYHLPDTFGIVQSGFLKNKLPLSPERMITQTLIFLHKDQPINTPSEKFSSLNYNLIAYEKTAEWLRLLEKKTGKETFNKIMRTYYERWKYKHPKPDDFKGIVQEVSGKPMNDFFDLLNKKGYLVKEVKAKIKPTFLFNLNQTRRTKYISFLPAAGYNYYDKLMVGGMVHNYNLPPTKLQFFAAPLYATGSKKLNGIGRVSYTAFPAHDARKLEVFNSFSHFTADNFQDSTGKVNYQPFTKIVPGFRYTFGNRDPLKNSQKFIEFKTYLIKETGLQFKTDSILQQNIITYSQSNRYISQLKVGIQNFRALYPYNAIFKAEQGKNFVRLAFIGDYFFNYAKGGGFNVRLFAGKFIYTLDKTFVSQFETDKYHLNLSGPKGSEDYTYSDYFYGRNEFDGLAARQIMERDGFFKVKTDFLSNKIGKSDDWLSAANFTTDIPSKINPFSLLPFKFPVRIFADIGTYSEAWNNRAASGRFLYDAGLQVNLFNDILNIYFPLVYSKVYKNYFKSTIPGNTFKNNIVFSIEFKNLQPRKIFPALGL